MSSVNDSPRLLVKDPSDMDEGFEIFFRTAGRRRRAIRIEAGLGWRPPTDVYETGDRFVVQVELAGMRAEEIEVVVDGDVLILRGRRDQIAPAGKKHYHKMEIAVGPFERHVQLPAHVDGASARARYEQGFLLVEFRRGEGRGGARRSISIDL